MEVYEALPLETLTQQEQRTHLATAAFDIAEQWAVGISDRLNTKERVHGAVHAVLNMLENGSFEVPAFHLAPVLREDHESFTTAIRGDGPVEADWDYGVIMDLRGPENEPSTTQLYRGIYDNHRERFTIAARELFDNS
jgi:hypothetical protein